jgi:hypothetical protein
MSMKEHGYRYSDRAFEMFFRRRKGLPPSGGPNAAYSWHIKELCRLTCKIRDSLLSYKYASQVAGNKI